MTFCAYRMALFLLAGFSFGFLYFKAAKISLGRAVRDGKAGRFYMFLALRLVLAAALFALGAVYIAADWRAFALFVAGIFGGRVVVFESR